MFLKLCIEILLVWEFRCEAIKLLLFQWGHILENSCVKTLSKCLLQKVQIFILTDRALKTRIHFIGTFRAGNLQIPFFRFRTLRGRIALNLNIIFRFLLRFLAVFDILFVWRFYFNIFLDTLRFRAWIFFVDWFFHVYENTLAYLQIICRIFLKFIKTMILHLQNIPFRIPRKPATFLQ